MLPLLTILRVGTAAVWLVFGLVFKVLHAVLRHDQIVAAVLGPDLARPLTIAVGAAETLLGLWILSGRWPRTCAAVQTLATITTRDGDGDVTVLAHIGAAATTPPAGSPFADLSIARRFAGPLPFTFGYEPSTHSMVIVQGLREQWQPMPVQVERVRCAFLERGPFAGVPPRLANAFFVENIPYRWQRGEIERLPAEVR